MSVYDDLVNMMRTQGAAQNPEGLLLAVMTGPDSCAIGELPLGKADLYIAEHLTKPVATKVNVPESHKDASAYLQPLKAGDLVLVQQMNETSYAVIEKLVKP